MARNESIEEKSFATARASKGGKARAAVLTPKQRSESARKAVNARWGNERSSHSVTVSSASANPFDRDVVKVEATYVYHDSEPQINSGGGSWNVNSRSYVITQNEIGSYTQ